MTKFWNDIPAPLRTIINVAFAAFLTWAATDGLDLLGSADFPVGVKGLLLAVVTAVVRSLNPADSVYGWGSSPADGEGVDTGVVGGQ